MLLSFLLVTFHDDMVKLPCIEQKLKENINKMTNSSSCLFTVNEYQ